MSAIENISHLRKAVKKHPHYADHQEIMKKLAAAVDKREKSLKQLVWACHDSLRADEFCDDHVEMRVLQKSLSLTRSFIAKDFGVSPQHADKLFTLPYFKK